TSRSTGNPGPERWTHDGVADRRTTHARHYRDGGRAPLAPVVVGGTTGGRWPYVSARPAVDAPATRSTVAPAQWRPAPRRCGRCPSPPGASRAALVDDEA